MFSQFLDAFLQEAAAVLLVKENAARTPAAVNVATIFKGLSFIQD